MPASNPHMTTTAALLGFVCQIYRCKETASKRVISLPEV